MAYVDPGLMTEIIDIWDQPPNSGPVVFMEGIHAQKTEIANTTQSPVSAALGQNIAWPRLVGQDVSLVTTVFVIQYVPGVKSRMFVLHHHPDDGMVRYDLDRPVDIDGQRHQLNLLTFKRADGADPFDAQLTSTLDILARDTAGGRQTRNLRSDLYDHRNRNCLSRSRREDGAEGQRSRGRKVRLPLPIAKSTCGHGSSIRRRMAPSFRSRWFQGSPTTRCP
jgi:hypothetical protein